MGMRPAAVAAVLAWACLSGGSCVPISSTHDAPEPTSEVEPNDQPASAQLLELSSAGDQVRISGAINTETDVDLFQLGDLDAGDQLAVHVEAAGTPTDLSVVIYDGSGGVIQTLFAAADFFPGATTSDPLMEEIIRHSGTYALGLMRKFGSMNQAQSYDVTVTIDRGGTVPLPQSQVLLLQFGGGTLHGENGSFQVIPFNAAAIDAAYTGQQQAIKNAIVATVRENFAQYGVDVYSSDEGLALSPGTFSTVFFGSLEAGDPSDSSEGLGMAPDGVDMYNKNPADEAIVFVRNFGTASLGLAGALDAASLGVVIGNVGTHEAGHLLGLHHVYDGSDTMRIFDAPDALLQDERFKRSLVHFTVFDPVATQLTQDARLLLSETVGADFPRADLTFQAGDTPFGLATEDLDADGRPDIVVANRFSNNLSVLFNGQPVITIELDANPIAVIALDADMDGRPDLLTANPEEHNLTLLEDIGGGFEPVATLAAGGRPRAMAAADFDGDGDLDVAVANYESSDVVVLWNGESGFSAGQAVATGPQPEIVLAADLNGDGRPDLATANSGSNDVSILTNVAGSFATAVSIPVGVLPLSLTAADLDGDGDLDLAAANALSSIYAVQFAGEVAVLMNRGDAAFDPPRTFFASFTPESIAAADLDADGDVDLAVACSGNAAMGDPGQVSILLNRGDGTFAQDRLLMAGQGPSAIAVADLDGDGRPDLVVANRDSDTVSVFMNAGAGRLGSGP